jgi:hypothetical protein
METCKSPRKVMRMAYELGRRCLPDYTSRFSRKDFTLPQLFACLVVREHQKQSYRGVEALLRDAQHWCRAIGMKRVPDHGTLHRAWKVLVRHAKMKKMLDLLAVWFKRIGRLRELLAIDASYFEAHHASRYYEQRCRRMAGEKPDKRGSYTRAAALGRVPKLTLGVDAASHAVLSAVASTGVCCDHPQFEPVLFDAWRRGRVRTVVTDAGNDSEKSHELARRDMGLKSIIPATKGRPGRSGRPNGHYRRMMHQRFARDGGGPKYRQRAQVETVNSMIKRNLGSHLRCRTPQRRELELILRAIVHNVMLIRRQRQGSRQSPMSPFLASAPAAHQLA